MGNSCGTCIGEETVDTFVANAALFPAACSGESAFQPSRRVFCDEAILNHTDTLPRFLDGGQTPKSSSDFLRDIVPSLDGRGHKGQAGRICVLGGSVDFAGAPYYAGMASLRVGGELAYMCTAEEATGPIKSYSPELMVSAIYNWGRMSDDNQATVQQEQDQMVAKMEALFPRLHCLVIGPGLGRDDRVLAAVARVIRSAKKQGLPLVIDADGLWLIERHPELMRDYRSAVLTPNAAEFRRLAKVVAGDERADLRRVCQEMHGPIILLKGAVDRICGPDGERVLECSEDGAPRRPGGLGDFLAGSLGTILAWACLRKRDKLHACVAASVVVRRACRAAYLKKKRAMVAPDVLEEVGAAFEELCPANSRL